MALTVVLTQYPSPSLNELTGVGRGRQDVSGFRLRDINALIEALNGNNGVNVASLKTAKNLGALFFAFFGREFGHAPLAVPPGNLNNPVDIPFAVVDGLTGIDQGVLSVLTVVQQLFQFALFAPLLPVSLARLISSSFRLVEKSSLFPMAMSRAIFLLNRMYSSSSSGSNSQTIG